MANVIINDTHLTDIADAIRSKIGSSDKMYPRDMASEIRSISSGIDTSDATAIADDILNYKTAYVDGKKITGSMPNIGSRDIEINDKNMSLNIAKGFHNGNGYAYISSEEQKKLIGENIKEGVTILGVIGTLQSGSSGKQVKTGTTTGTTINTGLSNIDIMIIFEETIRSLGLMNTIYTGGSSATSTVCSAYSDYYKYCEIRKSKDFQVSSGIFKWSGSSSNYDYFMTGASYSWIAIGD